MSYAPFRAETQTYKGTTFGFSFTINEDGSPLDLTTLDKVEITMFSSSTDVFTYDSNGQLSFSGSSNETVSGVAPESTMDIAKRVYYMELRLYFADDTKEVYAVVDNKIIDAESDQSQGAHDWVLDIDNDSETVTGQVTSLYAETVDLNQDTETLRDETQDEANDAQKHAQETTSFQDHDGNSFDKGAKGYSEDAKAIIPDLNFINSQIVKPEQVPIYDSFNRPDGVAGTADSGQSYTQQQGIVTQLGGTAEDVHIIDKGATVESNGRGRNGAITLTDSVLDMSSDKVGFLARVVTGGLHNFARAPSIIPLYVDDNNFIIVTYNNNQLTITEVRGGTVTTVSSDTNTTGDNTSATHPLIFNVGWSTYGGTGSTLIVSGWVAGGAYNEQGVFQADYSFSSDSYVDSLLTSQTTGFLAKGETRILNYNVVKNLFG